MNRSNNQADSMTSPQRLSSVDGALNNLAATVGMLSEAINRLESRALVLMSDPFPETDRGYGGESVNSSEAAVVQGINGNASSLNVLIERVNGITERLCS